MKKHFHRRELSHGELNQNVLEKNKIIAEDFLNVIGKSFKDELKVHPRVSEEDLTSTIIRVHRSIWNHSLEGVTLDTPYEDRKSIYWTKTWVAFSYDLKNEQLAGYDDKQKYQMRDVDHIKGLTDTSDSDIHMTEARIEAIRRFVKKNGTPKEIERLEDILSSYREKDHGSSFKHTRANLLNKLRENADLLDRMAQEIIEERGHI